MERSLFVAATLSAALLFPSSARAQTLGCAFGGTGGSIPAIATGGGGVYPGTLPPVPGVFTLNVVSIPAGATCVTEVKLNGLVHDRSDDVHFVLEDPAGSKVNLWVRPGGICRFADYYTYSAVPGPGTCATLLGCAFSSPIWPGAYPQMFGDFDPVQVWPSGTNGVFNTDLTSVAPQLGTWTLYAYDWEDGVAGALASWDLCFGTPPAPIPPCAVPTLVSPGNGVNVFGPVVTLTWSPVQGASSYEVDVDGNVTNVATSSFDFDSTVGGHAWRVRAVNAAGTTAYAAPRTFNDIGIPPSPCTGGTDLNTIDPFQGNNGGPVVMFFDVNVTNAAGITLSQLDTNTSLASANAFGMDIYMKAGTYHGFEANQAAWTLMANGGGISRGAHQRSLVEFTDFDVPPGYWGVALVLIGAVHRYDTGNGVNQYFSNADLSIILGKSQHVPFGGASSYPHVWNGTLRYDCGGAPPTSYCTAGTSTNGCTAAITADDNPSVSQVNPCNLSVAGVAGQKSGLIFYGLTPTATPWATGSTSFSCVKAPTQRTPTQSSGGTPGLCDGSLALDLDAYLTANPGSLGQPFAAGNKIYAQAWYRDSPAPKKTNLSDGVELTFEP